MPADLHLHSSYSDGSLTPAELVKLADNSGLTTIALSDHDTVSGIEEAILSGRKYGIEVIPAIEFSTFKGEAEIHILGYYIDYNNDRLIETIKRIFKARVDRAREMVELLNKQGIELSFAQVRELAGDDYVGRPHIARALVQAGYINKMGEAFTDEYIGNGGKAYVPKFKILPEKAIEIIKQVGGIAVLAHPVFINHGQPLKFEDIEGLKKAGIEGVEVYHSKHDKEASEYYKKVAEELNLIITGGSDFHGENSPDIKMGDIILPDKYIDPLRELAAKKKAAL